MACSHLLVTSVLHSVLVYTAVERTGLGSGVGTRRHIGRIKCAILCVGRRAGVLAVRLVCRYYTRCSVVGAHGGHSRGVSR